MSTSSDSSMRNVDASSRPCQATTCNQLFASGIRSVNEAASLCLDLVPVNVSCDWTDSVLNLVQSVWLKSRLRCVEFLCPKEVIPIGYLFTSACIQIPGKKLPTGTKMCIRTMRTRTKMRPIVFARACVSLHVCMCRKYCDCKLDFRLSGRKRRR